MRIRKSLWKSYSKPREGVGGTGIPVELCFALNEAEVRALRFSQQFRQGGDPLLFFIGRKRQRCVWKSFLR